VVGKGEVIPGFEEAVRGMKVGGIRRIIVPPELGYPDNDYNKQGPKPTNFSVSKYLLVFCMYLGSRQASCPPQYATAKCARK
jgi:hypothetical protein